MPLPEAGATWRERPERSAAGALAGLVAAWLLGGALLLAMVEMPGKDDAAVSGSLASSTMAGILAALVLACGARPARRWAGHLVPGLAVGWALGCASLVLLRLATAL